MARQLVLQHGKGRERNMAGGVMYVAKFIVCRKVGSLPTLCKEDVVWSKAPCWGVTDSTNWCSRWHIRQRKGQGATLEAPSG